MRRAPFIVFGLVAVASSILGPTPPAEAGRRELKTG